MIIVISGTDSYRLQHTTEDVVASARQSRAIEVTTVDCATEQGREQLERIIKYPSFFQEPTLVIAHHAAHEDMAPTLKEHDLSSFGDIIFVAVQNTSRGTPYEKKVLNALIKKAERHELCDPMKESEQALWVSQYCLDRGSTIETPALRELLRRQGGSTRELALSLDTLTAYTRTGTITLNDVKLLTAPAIDVDEWELSNAIAAYDKRAIVSALWRRTSQGTPEQLLIGLLASGIRNALMIRDLRTRNTPTVSIATTTGIHPYVVTKSLRGAERADAEKLTRALHALSALDQASKDGRADAVDGMFTTVLAL